MRSPASIVETSCLSQVEALMQEDAGAVVIEVATRQTSTAREVGRVVENVARACDRNVTFARIEAEKHPDLARFFEVRSLPTVLFVLDGEVVDAMMGRIEAPALTKRVSWLARRADGVGFFARLLRRRA